jgi:hypothetical protein
MKRSSGAGDRPGIALIADKFMHDGKRRARLAFHQLDRAEQYGRILEMGDVNQKTPDLDFRVHARLNAALRRPTTGRSWRAVNYTREESSAEQTGPEFSYRSQFHSTISKLCRLRSRRGT